MKPFFFISMFIIYVAANGYVLARIFKNVLNGFPMLKAACALLFGIMISCLVIFFAIRGIEMPIQLQRIIYLCGTSWLIVILFATITFALFDIAKLVMPSFKYGTHCAICLTTFILALGYKNYQKPEVCRIDIQTEKTLSSPVKVVAVSDVHLGVGTNKAILKKYVNMINAEQPDLIIIAGDLIDNSVDPLFKQNMQKELSCLKAPLGIFMAPGNHEYISNIDSCKKFTDQTPIKMLRDSIVRLDCNINIICRDDKHNRNRQPLEELVRSVDKDAVSILLDHQPFDVAKKDSLGIDIQFSGHTHRGQVWPISLITDALFEQSHGYRKWKNSHVYVSSGLSIWGAPFRIGTNSDMAVFTISGK